MFSVVPVEGIMEPGKAQDFTVTFSPDHESLYFSDRLQVVLFEKVRWAPPCPCPARSPLGLEEPSGKAAALVFHRKSHIASC